MTTNIKNINHIFLTIFTVFVTTNLFSAADSEHPLILTNKPIPLDKTLSFSDILSRREQYNRDAKRLSEIAECANILNDNTSHVVQISGCKEIGAIVYYIAISCSSQLSYHCINLFKNSTKLTAGETAALAQLIHKSKIAIDALPEKERDALCLGECEDCECPASRYRFPAVRSFMVERIVEKEASRSERKPVTCCFFASGYLAQEHAILTALAEKSVGFDVRNVVIVDNNYFYLLRAFEGSASRGLALSTKDTLQKNHDAYNKIFSQLSRGSIDIAFSAILKLHSNLGAIEHFKKSIHNLFPNLERILVYSDARQYISACLANPCERADLLIGSDFKDKNAPEFKSSSWEFLWDDFQATHKDCLKESGTAWSLTTLPPLKAYLTMFDASETKEWQHEIEPKGPLNQECGFWKASS